MKKTIVGDTPGVEFALEVLTFKGSDPKAPGAYLQAALHGGEFPGVAAIHFLVPMLEAAEKEGKIAGDITIVPMANPIGSSQWLFGEPAGRFDFASRINFNREHYSLHDFDTSGLPALGAPISADKRLKAELLRLALPHEIILDLHCDSESEQYFYAPRALWPAMQDLAAALNCSAVLLWQNTADGAFEEVAANPTLKTGADAPHYKRRAVTTIEFKGMVDVSAEKGRTDAKGLFNFLTHRGTISGKSNVKPSAFAGPAVTLDQVEMIYAPVGGMVFYHVEPGDTVRKGEKLATIVSRPGDHGGDVIMTAPQAGLILTRRDVRATQRGGDLIKLIGSKPSATAKSGSLEA
ncbi:MAG: peptidase M14 [Rhizobiaceae bacterium]